MKKPAVKPLPEEVKALEETRAEAAAGTLETTTVSEARTTLAKRSKDGGVVIEATKDKVEGKRGTHVILRGGVAVEVEDSENPEIY